MNDNFLELPLIFEPSKLEYDHRICIQKYSADWKSISLRSYSGNETDVLSKPGIQYKDTALISECSYFKQVLSSFKCELESARLLRLEAGTFIYEHCKQPFRYEDGYFRVYIPIQTNPRVSFRVNSNLIFMKPGECWYVNCNQPHSISNNGNADLIHLVVDARRNEWTDSLARTFDRFKKPSFKKPELATMEWKSGRVPSFVK
jgi:hypothetical protein